VANLAERKLSSLTYIVKDFPATVEYMLGVMSDTKRREVFTSWGKELRAEPQSTVHTASTMSSCYQLLVKEKMRQYIQVTNWGILQMRQRNICQAMHPGEFVTRAGPYGCRPLN
jgi:hypothetical protein